ncbi:hypothetical protein [Hafnia phage yong3]|nr:hypothetical protein [Hafnia phage yong3]
MKYLHFFSITLRFCAGATVSQFYVAQSGSKEFIPDYYTGKSVRNLSEAKEVASRLHLELVDHTCEV